MPQIKSAKMTENVRLLFLNANCVKMTITNIIVKSLGNFAFLYILGNDGIVMKMTDI